VAQRGVLKLVFVLLDLIEVTGKFHRGIVVANSTDICMVDIRSLAIPAYYMSCVFTLNHTNEVRLSCAIILSFG